MKKKLFFKVTALLIVAAMIFAACGGGGSAEPTTTAPAAGATTTTTAPTATTQPGGDLPPPEAAAPEFPDMGGRVMRISSGANSNFGFMGRLTDTSEFFVPDPEGGDYARLRLQYDNRVRVEEAFNIVIEPVAMGGGTAFDVMTVAFLAGEIYADAMNMSTGPAIRSMLAGYIYPLDVLAARLPVELDLFTTQYTAWPCLVVDGHTWNMARPLPSMNNAGIFVNLDIIEAFGAPNPVELFYAGEWTWDAMRQIMEMTTADTTGDGNIDTWGASGSLNGAIRHLMIANDAVTLDVSTLELGHTTPEAMAALQFVYDIFANGWWMAGDWAHETPSRGMAANDLSFGRGLSALGIGTTPGNINNQLQDGFNANLSWVPFPAGPNNTSGYTSESGGRGGAGVLVGVEDPHYVLWILDELFAWPGELWYEMEFTADMEWARRFMPDEASVQRIFREGMYGQRIDLGYRTGITGPLHQNMVENWWNGTMTVAQSVEYWRAERENAAHEFFGNWRPSN